MESGGTGMDCGVKLTYYSEIIMLIKLNSILLILSEIS